MTSCYCQGSAGTNPRSNQTLAVTSLMTGLILKHWPMEDKIKKNKKKQF